MTCRTSADPKITRIAPTPKQMLTALDKLRRLDRQLNGVEDAAFTAAAQDFPAPALAAFRAAEAKIADAGRLIRAEIARLEDETRGVAYVRPPASPHPMAAGALVLVDGGVA
jgi:hypothetical protein